MKLTTALADPACCPVWLQGLGQGAPEAPRRSQLIASVRATKGTIRGHR
jgi:hypothetical protein